MDESNISDKIKRIMLLNDISACQEYLKVLTDYLFDVILKLHGKKFSSVRMNESGIWVQMMFTNTLAFSKLLEGMSYERDDKRLNPIIDHRMIFSLGRTMYENLIIFELLYILPTDEDKKTLIYDLYEAAGYKEQLDVLLNEEKQRYPDRVKEIEDSLDGVKSEAHSTLFYTNSTEQVKQTIDNAINSGKFRYRFNSDGTLKKVEYDEGMELIEVNSEIFTGMYKYFSNLSHPSHWGQLQFEQSFDAIKPEYISLACTATKYVVTFLCLFINDFKKISEDAKQVLAEQSPDNQQLIMLYNHMFRGDDR